MKALREAIVRLAREDWLSIGDLTEWTLDIVDAFNNAVTFGGGEAYLGIELITLDDWQVE